MRIRMLPALLAAVLLGVGIASAQDRVIYGTRAFGMGGASVAVVQDATAVVVNPAAMGFLPATDFQFPMISVDATLQGDVLGAADRIADTLSGTTLQEIIDELDRIPGDISDLEAKTVARRVALDLFLYDVAALDEAGTGAKARGLTGPAYRFKNFGFALTGTLDATLGFELDLQNGLSLGNLGFDTIVPDDPGNDTCDGNAFCEQFAAELRASTVGLAYELTPGQAEQIVVDADPNRLAGSPKAQQVLQAIVRNTADASTTLAQNQSAALTGGIAYFEFAFGYGRRIGTSKWAVGGTLNVMAGQTYTTTVLVSDFEDENYLDAWDDRNNVRNETRFGIDLGVLYRPAPKWCLGLTGQNLNEPSFDVALENRKIVFDSQFTLGAAWMPARWVSVAADVDLTESTSTFVDRLNFQYGRVGAEFVPVKPLALRVGAFRNFGLEQASIAWTGGLGVRIGRFEVAVAGILSDSEFEVRSDSLGSVDSYPSGAGVSFSLGWNPPWNRTRP
jgi:hypothetical protein